MFKRFFLFIIFVSSLSASNGALQLSPLIKGEVSTDIESIVFKSSKPIFKSEQVGSFTHKPLLQCTPDIKAAFEYAEIDQIRVFPQEILSASTLYKCKLKDLQSKPAIFQTTSFAVKDMRYFQEGIVRLEFNDKVDKKRLQNSLKIYKKINLAKVKLAYSLQADNEGMAFIAKINEPVENDSVEVTVNNTLTNLSGKKLSQTVSKIFKKDDIPFVLDKKRKSMPIFDKPRFIALDDGKVGVRFYFPGYFYSSETPMKSYIAINGVKNFSVSESRYVGYDERQKYHIHDNSVSYVDIVGDFEPVKSYKITIKKGLKDGYRYQLRDDKIFKVKMGDRKSAVHFENSEPYISSKGEIGFKSVNLDKVTLIIEKIPDQNYRYFTNFQNAKEDQTKRFSTQVFSKEVTLSNEKNKFIKQKISLNELTDNYKSGIFRVVFRYGKKSAQKVIFLSDFGISAKISNNQAFVSVAKLSDTQAVSGAKVELFSLKNELIGTAKTDKNGICVIEKKELGAQKPHLVIVTHEDEKNFLVLNETLNGVKIPFETSIYENYKSWVYLQSRIIRPGSTAKMLIVIKDKAYKSIENLPVKIEVKSPDFKTIYKNVHHSDTLGAIEFLLDIPKFYKTGKYEISVGFSDKKIGSQTFFVESFLPQNIKNEIKTSKEIFKKDEPIEVDISSNYLFGAPAAGLSVEARITAVSKAYESKKYKNYSFTNTLIDTKNIVNYLDFMKHLSLNDQGSAKVIFPAGITQKVPSILKAQIGVSVFDDGREVTEYKSVDIYPYEKLAGVYIKDNAIQKGESVKINVILIDPISGENEKTVLNAVLKKVIWRYAYNDRGFYQWEKEFENIEQFEITTGESLEKKIEVSGEYVIELHDRLGGHSAAQEFSVRGWDYANISPADDLGKIEISVEDKLYKKGDTLKVGIKSPVVKGRVLFTIEGDEVLYHEIVYIDKGSASIDILLDFALKEGVYLHASAVRATDTPSNLIPFRARNSVFIKPDKREHKVDVSIDSVSISKSHKSVPVTIKTSPDTAVLVSVVDEGILQIIDQKPPTPFTFFTRVPKEKIALYDLYEKVMHHLTEGKLLKFGSGDAAEMMMARKHQAPDTDAKRVKPFMYWSGLMKSDQNGKVTVDVQIPSFNGKAKIVTIALVKDGIGANFKDLSVRDEVIIKPTYPRSLHIGDKITIPVRIFNTTKKEISVVLSTKVSNNLSLSTIPKTLAIPANSSKVLETQLLAISFGKGEVQIDAKYGNETFFHKLELPIISADALQTKVYAGESDKNVDITVPKAYFSKGGTKVKLTLDKTYIAQLKGAVDDLINYPYGCTEQVSSKLLALLNSGAFIKNDKSAYAKNLLNDRKIFIKEGILKLLNVQLENGDFAYWKEGRVNPFASVYASDVFISLQKNGFETPEVMMEKVYNALETIASRGREYGNIKYAVFERVYAAYLLSNEKKLPLSTLNMMYDNGFYKNSIVSLYMMAAILKNANLDDEAQKLFSMVKTYDYNKMSDMNQLGGNFYSKARDLSFALYLHVKHFGKDKTAFKLLEEAAKSFKNLYSTQDKAFAMRAIALYYKDMPSDAIEVTLTLNGKKQKITEPITIFENLESDTILIKSNGKRFNYNVEVSGYLPIKPNSIKKVFNKELNIHRDFVDIKGKILDLDKLKLGDLIYSKVMLQSSKAIENIVVNERIPSCFEIVNERLGQSVRPASVQNSQNFYPDIIDIRDDRVLTFLSLPKPKLLYNQKTKRQKIKPNLIVFYTPMRVTSRGICQLSAIQTEAMYDSRIGDYSKSRDQIVVK